MSYVKSELLLILMSNILCIHSFKPVLDLEDLGKFVLVLSVFLLNPEFSALFLNSQTRRVLLDTKWRIFCYFMSHFINLITA